MLCQDIADRYNADRWAGHTILVTIDIAQQLLLGYYQPRLKAACTLVPQFV